MSREYNPYEDDEWDVREAVCYEDGMTFVMPSGNAYHVVGAERCSPNFHEDAWKNGGFSVKVVAGEEDADEMVKVVEGVCKGDMNYGYRVDGVFHSHFGFGY